MTQSAMTRFLTPERNVGGGDLVIRVFATGVLAALTAVVLPQLNVPYALMKIVLLTASEFGLVCLMLGMFLRSKTYFVGFQLFVASLLMLLLAGRQLAYVAAVVGLIFIGIGLNELITRRSRLNGLLGISSFTASDAEATLLEQALLPDPTEAKSTAVAGAK